MTADTLSTLRRWMLGILLFGLIGTGVELVLLSHYEDAWQLAPLILIATALLALAAHQIGGVAGGLRFFRWTMAAFIVAGMLGVGLHFNGAAEFQREMDPSQSGWSVFAKAIRVHAPPILAPGLMAQIGLLGLAFTYKYSGEGG